jgi:hypothetical protein
VLKHCAAIRKRRLSALPNVDPYTYDVKISGFTRSSIYSIYDISRLRVNSSPTRCTLIFFISFLTTLALHVSGAICTHHQEHNCCIYLLKYKVSRFIISLPDLTVTIPVHHETPHEDGESLYCPLTSFTGVSFQQHDDDVGFQHVGNPSPGDGCGWGQCGHGRRHGSKPNCVQPPAEGRCNGEWLLLHDTAPNIRPADLRGLWYQTIAMQPHSTLPGYERAPIFCQRHFIHR